MKKILMILSFALFSIGLNACKKDKGETFCVACTVETTTTSSDGAEIPIDMDAEVEQCDITQAQFNEMMKSGTVTTSSKMGDVTLTMKMVTKCNKK